MNIQLLSTNYYHTYSAGCVNRKMQCENLKPLSADTVSFTGAKNIGTKAVSSLSDAFGYSYDDGIYKSKVIAKKFMDTISAVANEVEGLEFYRELYEGKVIKGKDSFLSKLIRSGAAPLDHIRTTVFIKDLYDMSILTKFIKKMSERGYEVMMIPAKTSGRKVLEWKPDLDIRLKDVPEGEIKKLPEKFRDCVSKRLPSGLSDIQIRFVDKLSNNEKPLEVIVMYGKESGLAKIVEEEDVYKYLRRLKNELHVSQIKDYDSKSPIKRIKDNTVIIGDILHNAISRPMYANAVAKDTGNTDLGLQKVGLPEEQGKIIQGLIQGIRDKIGKYYNDAIKKVNSEEYKAEIQRMIKSSPAYKESEDKTIYVEDILNKRKEILKNLRTNKKEDLMAIIDIQNGLLATIEKYKLN